MLLVSLAHSHVIQLFINLMDIASDVDKKISLSLTLNAWISPCAVLMVTYR